MTNPLISIIMPVKNAESFLDECLLSIINQSEDLWELIAVDDHSTDESLEILRKYESTETRIKVIDNQGAGIIDALNIGFQKSKGMFISRMDADDIMPSDKLAILKSLLLRNGPGHLSTGKVEYISDQILGDGFKKYENWLNRLCESNSHYDEIYRECVIPSPCWMMYRKDFERIGGFNADSYPEDYDLCFRMYAESMKVLPSLEVLHIWRDHGQRASRNDDNYADNRFLDMKVRYFLELDYDQDRQLILWGAGKKGKRIAQLLISNNIQFEWITNNHKKIGKDIYGKVLTSKEKINSNLPSTNIIAIANAREQSEVNQSLMKDFKESKIYPFC